MPRVRIKPGLTHTTTEGKHVGGDVVSVTDAEMVSFGDKFALLDDSEMTPHERIIASVARVMADADATPAARKLAAEHGISLADVPGTGKDGRITKADVEAKLQEEATHDIEIG